MYSSGGAIMKHQPSPRGDSIICLHETVFFQKIGVKDRNKRFENMSHMHFKLFITGYVIPVSIIIPQ